MTLGMAAIKRILTFVLLCIVTCLWVPISSQAQEARPTSKHFHREYMIYQPTENILAVLRDYRRYNRLFPDIDKTKIHTENKLHTIVRYEVRVMKRDFGALMEFHETSWSNVTVIRGRPIRLYNMTQLDGSLAVYNLGPKKTKLVVDFSVKPKVFLPGFFIERMIEKTFDQAIRRLKQFSWQVSVN